MRHLPQEGSLSTETLAAWKTSEHRCAVFLSNLVTSRSHLLKMFLLMDCKHSWESLNIKTTE